MALLGLVSWSLYHYVGHRVWHVHMHHGHRNALLEQEIKHHIYYDEPAHPNEKHIAFPWTLWALTGAMVTVFALFAGWVNGAWFGLGAFGGMVVDDQMHRAMHRKTLQWPWFVRWHQAHHRTHAGNFAMVTGAVWDVLFCTVAR